MRNSYLLDRGNGKLFNTTPDLRRSDVIRVITGSLGRVENFARGELETEMTTTWSKMDNRKLFKGSAKDEKWVTSWQWRGWWKTIGMLQGWNLNHNLFSLQNLVFQFFSFDVSGPWGLVHLRTEFFDFSFVHWHIDIWTVVCERLFDVSFRKRKYFLAVAPSIRLGFNTDGF